MLVVLERKVIDEVSSLVLPAFRSLAGSLLDVSSAALPWGNRASRLVDDGVSMTGALLPWAQPVECWSTAIATRIVMMAAAAAIFAIFITIWFVILWYVGACYTAFVLNSLWSIVGWLDIFLDWPKALRRVRTSGVANAVVERRR